MPRPEDTSHLETWEATTNGTAWVWTFDKREDKYVKVRVGGRSGSKKLHIRADDRRYNQDQIVDENKSLDVFTNGFLKLLDNEEQTTDVDRKYHLDQDDLIKLLSIKDEGIFKGEVDDITSELILRRLTAVAEKHGQVWQLEYLRDLVEERYKGGGTQKAVREMIVAGELSGGMALS